MAVKLPTSSMTFNHAPLKCPHCQRRRLSYTSTRRKVPNQNTTGDGNIVNEKGEKQIDKDKIGEKGEVDGDDPRVADLGRAIEDDFKLIKEKYGTFVRFIPHGKL